MQKIYTLLVFIQLVSILPVRSQQEAHDNEPKKFLNLGLIGFWCTNGENTSETTNNVSISLLYGDNKHVYGFALAPFNFIESSMHGLQVGFFNSAQGEAHGLQIGGGNGTGNLMGVQIGLMNGVSEKLEGVQIGGMNYVEKPTGGVQIGIGNKQKSGSVQIGLVNIAEHNDYPIGFVNIIKDGDMNAGITTDEMSNVTATFRSGGKYLYGIFGAGYSFASSLNQLTFEYGLGAHYHISGRFRIDKEITGTSITKTFVHTGSKEDYEEKVKNYDFKTAFRLSVRLLPTYRFGNHIEVFGGPSFNYLYSSCMENKKIFPSNHVWRKFSSHSLRQLHLGWTAGIQYKL